jgi:hypothetical protein
MVRFLALVTSPVLADPAASQKQSKRDPQIEAVGICLQGCRSGSSR